MNASVRALLCLLVLGCASAPPRPTRTLPLPEAERERDRLLDDLGARALSAIGHGVPESLLLDDEALGVLLQPSAATRASVLRAAATLRNGQAAMRAFAGARYAGICVQGARLQPAGPALGLRAPSFVLDRALVRGLLPDQTRIAAWVEGTFVLTDHGFFAVSLARVEVPRPEHADLDLALCDLATDPRLPPQLVASGAALH